MTLSLASFFLNLQQQQQSHHHHPLPLFHALSFWHLGTSAFLLSSLAQFVAVAAAAKRWARTVTARAARIKETMHWQVRVYINLQPFGTNMAMCSSDFRKWN